MKKRQRKKNFKKWIKEIDKTEGLNQLREDVAQFNNESSINMFAKNVKMSCESLEKIGV